MDIVIWMLATTCSFFVKGLCGFANTLVFQSILSFQNDNKNISPVELILTYPANTILLIKERKSIKWSVCLPLTLLVVAGSIPGILLLKSADTTVIKIIFGIVTVLVAIEMYFREKKEKQQRRYFACKGCSTKGCAGAFRPFGRKYDFKRVCAFGQGIQTQFCKVTRHFKCGLKKNFP